MLQDKLALATLWSFNGLVEKYLLATRSPQAFATTKALCVAAGYVVARPDTIDLTLLQDPRSWLLIAISLFNTPLYARIAKNENPALALPVVAACSQIMRLVWMHLLLGNVAWTTRKLCGVFLVIAGGWCIG